MKAEVTTTKGNKHHVKVVTIQHSLSKSELAGQTEPISTTLVRTKQALAQRLAAELLAGKLAEFQLLDNAEEESVHVVVTAYVIPPEKMKDPALAPTLRIWTP